MSGRGERPSSPPVRVLVCGSRTVGVKDAHLELMSSVLAKLPSFALIIHGDAFGADKLAGKWAELHGHMVEKYPADWKAHGKAAGPIRNAKMLATGVDLVIAFWDGKSRGTANMIDLAKRAGVPTEIHHVE